MSPNKSQILESLAVLKKKYVNFKKLQKKRFYNLKEINVLSQITLSCKASNYGLREVTITSKVRRE